MITAHNLESVSVSIEHTQKVGVDGPSGQYARKSATTLYLPLTHLSGQSSVILAVLNMVDYSGTIHLDGREIKSVPRDLLRSRITTITHDSVKLAGSVRFNLDPLSVTEIFFSDEELNSMLNRVYLLDTVRRRGGLDADISRMRFSKAQKQLLSLARAALHRRRTQSKVVLIDEATCSLNNETDKNMQDFMDGEFAACTVITVARRLSAYETADMVLMMDAGRINGILERDEETGQWALAA